MKITKVKQPWSVGFEFLDENSVSCTIEHSLHPGKVYFGTTEPSTDSPMLLSQEMMKDLLPMLQHFAETGELKLPKKKS